MYKTISMKVFLAALVSCLITVLFAYTASAGDKKNAETPNYPDVRIKNKTKFHVDGEVWYGGSFLCKDDQFSIPPGGTWRHSRGLCLIGRITAGGGGRTCTKYESAWGTGFAEFEVVGDEKGCKVIRP